MWPYSKCTLPFRKKKKTVKKRGEYTYLTFLYGKERKGKKLIFTNSRVGGAKRVAKEAEEKKNVEKENQLSNQLMKVGYESGSFSWKC